MEALVVVAQHRNQYYGRGRQHASKGFKGINCRTFHSDTGILPSPPPKAYSYDNHMEPKSPCVFSEPPKQSKRSKPIPINPRPSPKGATFNDDLSYSELWAGPAYSNSPPPSSLPIPKFSLRQKRSISLELPLSEPEVIIRHVSKSAPSSPSRQPSPSACEVICDVATENLRRMLNLDLVDD